MSEADQQPYDDMGMRANAINTPVEWVGILKDTLLLDRNILVEVRVPMCRCMNVCEAARGLRVVVHVGVITLRELGSTKTNQPTD